MIDREIRARVNKVAHAMAAAEYARLRVAILAELEAAQEDGATPEQLLKLLNDHCARQVRASATEANR